MNDFYQIRSYTDGSAVYTDDHGRLYFCASSYDEPQHADTPCRGGQSAAESLQRADAEQSAA